MKNVILLIILLFACIGSTYSQESDEKKETKVLPEGFKIVPTGRIYVDLAKYFKDKEPLSSGAAFGDIRFGMKAAYQQWQGEIVFGFANSAISFKDIFLQYNMQDKKSHFKLGHYVEPMGIEYIDGSVGNKFVSSSSAS